MVTSILNADFGSIFILFQVLSFLLFVVLIFFGPKLLMWQVNRRLRDTLIDLETFHQEAERHFLSQLKPNQELKDKYMSLKDFKLSPPTNIDPSGAVERLEHVLDNSENKFDRFIDQYTEAEDEEQKADLQMGFKGVLGTYQIYKVMRHFQQLVKKTGNFQLIGVTQMMIPIYKEISEAQKEATRAFIDGAPIGDSIGPLVAARHIEKEDEEIEQVAERIIHSEETINETQTLHVIKPTGPGARLGKYGDALETIAEENEKLDAVITVDAAAKFEGEETGQVAEGIGVMMGGPGVEKTKIEQVATDNDIPLEGIIIKQTAPEASKPMKKEIYHAHDDAEKKVAEVAREFPEDANIVLIGVGNTVGVPNTKAKANTVHNKLHKYWKEYEEQEEDEVSYIGLMSTLPGGANQIKLEQEKNNLIWSTIR